MKKILAIILVFLTSCNVVFAQSSYPRWHGDELFYPHLTTLGSTSWIMVNNNGQTSVISGTALATALGVNSNILISNNNFSGSNTFSGTLSIPGSLLSTTTNGIAIVNSKLSYATGNVINNVATEDFVASYISANGIAGDLSIYSQKAGNETWTGAKTLNNLFDLRGGSLRLPYKTSLITLSGNQDVYVYSDGTVRFSTKDADNNKYDGIFASREWVLANVSVTGLSSTQAQTNITSSLTWNGGYINLAASKLIIAERASTGYGDLTYSLDQGTAGLYYGIGVYSPSSETVDSRIAAKVNYTPYTIPASVIDIGLNYNVYQKTVSTETTFTFSNTTNKRLELWISNSGLSYIHFTAPSGYTIVYPDGFNQPFTGLHLYSIMIHNNKIFIRKDMTTAL